MKAVKELDFDRIWDIGVFDAHCHPTDIMDSIARIPDMKARALTVMSTRAEDQVLVEQTARDLGVRSKHDLDPATQTSKSITTPSRSMIPAFGWHPWFSHQLWDDRSMTDSHQVDARDHYRGVLNLPPDNKFLEDLPRPSPLSKFLLETEQRLEKHPFAVVGEIGLDRSFRIPEGPNGSAGDVSRKTGGDEGAYTPGSREGRPLTPYKVNMEHQKLILKAQLQLAAKHKRAVSVHSVQAHGVVFEVMQSLWKGHEKLSKRKQKKHGKDAPHTIGVEQEKEETESARGQHESRPYPPRICMHSFSGPAETLKLFLDPKIPADIYVSFSECINFNSPAWKKATEAIRMVPEDRILVESDLHCAGVEMDKLLEKIVRRVCEIKEWELEQGANILKKNWSRFIFGD